MNFLIKNRTKKFIFFFGDVYYSGHEWDRIKLLRDEYNEFVGQPGIKPGSVVTTAIETCNLRSWRYAPLQENSREMYTVLETSD